MCLANAQYRELLSDAISVVRSAAQLLHLIKGSLFLLCRLTSAAQDKSHRHPLDHACCAADHRLDVLLVHNVNERSHYEARYDNAQNENQHCPQRSPPSDPVVPLFRELANIALNKLVHINLHDHSFVGLDLAP
jgi:hypothetical protein